MPSDAGIVGLGSYTPERIMTNDDWARLVDTSDEWITSRTGIKRRRIAAEEESTADLALAAAQRALADAGLEPGDLGEIVVATDTPEVYTPDTASFLQHRLGASEIPAYDLGGSGCAGFVQALDLARSRILTGTDNVLVIGVELISRLISPTERETCVLFGDAAGAAVVGRNRVKARILAAAAGTDGSQSDILILRVGGSRHPFTVEAAQAGLHQHLEMNGREVFRHAVARMAQVGLEVLAKAGLSLDDVDLVIPHQANLRIINAVRARLELPSERVYVNVDEYGNTGSASVPLALALACSEGRIEPGNTVLLVAFGAGFHWAGALLQF